MRYPIVLTTDGDVLTNSELAEHDESIINYRAGEHLVCGGCLDFSEGSKLTNVLHCRKCGLRVTLGLEIELYSHLRSFLANLQPKEWAFWESSPEVGRELVCVRSHWLIKKGMKAKVIPRAQHSKPCITWVIIPELVGRISDEGRRMLYPGDIGEFGTWELVR
jgi:hypothetical protein